MNKKYYINVIIGYKNKIFLAVMPVSTKNKKEGIIIRFVIPIVFINS